MAFFAYNLLLLLASPILLPYALLRGWRRGQPLNRLGERLGSLPRLLLQTAPDSIWLHAVSVGEVLSCARLVEDLRRRFPSAPIFVSTTTASGQQMAIDKLSGKSDGIFYAPLDLAFIVRRVLRHLKPRLVIVAETEIWPNLFRETKRTGAALLLINGRISDQSQASYRRWRFFFRQVLRLPDRILCQSAVDRDRFIAAGAPEQAVTVNGNLKYDFEPGAAELPPVVADLLTRIQPEPLIVAGSTREDEEQPVLEAFRVIAKTKPRALLVIAPRHPQRFEEVAALLAASGVPFRRRSELKREDLADLPLPGILLLDSLGELASLYRAANVVFVGGSLNGWGGHNVLEPALYGRPVIVGPHMQNFRAVAETLLEQRGMAQVNDSRDLAPALLQLLNNPAAAKQLGERGRKVAERQRGATARIVDASEQLLRQSRVQTSPSLFRSILLGPPALLWRAAASLRIAAYRNGWLRRNRLNAFTICVGNLTTGGAGKTPMVAWLVERLHQAGHTPAVLTRGYGRSSSGQTILYPGERADVADCGDEALMLLRLFEQKGLKVPIAIGADRYESGRRVLSSSAPRTESAPNVLILDDGFQHLKLERDLDFVLIDVTNPFGGGNLLPLGRLREPLSSLSRAGAILLTRTEPGQSYPTLEQQLRRWNRRAPIFRCSTRPVSVVHASNGSESPLSTLAGQRILAFCGLGNPESFWRMLRREGLQVVHRIAFADHHRYTPQDLQRIAQAADDSKAGLLLTTEKDMMNLIAGPNGSPLTSRFDPTLTGAIEKLNWLQIETIVEQEEQLLSWIKEKASGKTGTTATKVTEGQARAQVRA